MMGLGLVSLIVLVVGIVFFIKYIFPIDSNSGNILNNENSLNILKKHFANGDISKEEFEEKKHLLQ